MYRIVLDRFAPSNEGREPFWVSRYRNVSAIGSSAVAALEAIIATNGELAEVADDDESQPENS